MNVKRLICLLVFIPALCYAQEVNIKAIAVIESSNNPRAFNKYSQARGLCQITPVCLKEYNELNRKSFVLSDLFSPEINLEIATWYMNVRIPQMLRHYKQKDTIENRLICYNAGIGNLLKGIVPNETKNYILKYRKEVKQ